MGDRRSEFRAWCADKVRKASVVDLPIGLDLREALWRFYEADLDAQGPYLVWETGVAYCTVSRGMDPDGSPAQRELVEKTDLDLQAMRQTQGSAANAIRDADAETRKMRARPSVWRLSEREIAADYWRRVNGRLNVPLPASFTTFEDIKTHLGQSMDAVLGDRSPARTLGPGFSAADNYARVPDLVLAGNTSAFTEEDLYDTTADAPSSLTYGEMTSARKTTEKQKAADSDDDMGPVPSRRTITNAKVGTPACPRDSSSSDSSSDDD